LIRVVTLRRDQGQHLSSDLPSLWVLLYRRPSLVRSDDLLRTSRVMFCAQKTRLMKNTQEDVGLPNGLLSVIKLEF